MEQSLEDLDRVVASSDARELRARGLELHHRAFDVLHAAEGLRQAKVRKRVRGIELDDPTEHFDRFLIALLALEARRDFVEGRERVARQTELLIEIRELRCNVPVFLFEMRDVLRDDLADLLVDRDRFEREALVRVQLSDGLVRRDGVGMRAHLLLQIADLEEGPSIVRIRLDQLLQLYDRLVVFLLLDELLGGLEHLVAIYRHVGPE